MRLVRPALLSACAALVVSFFVALGGAPAHADGTSGGTTDGGGFGLQAVDVQVSAGSGDPISTGPIQVSVPPKCWWGPVDISLEPLDTDDTEDMQTFIDDLRSQMRGHAAAGYFALPTPEYVRNILRRSRDEPYQWYSLNSQKGVNCAEEGFTNSHGTPGDAYGGDGAGDQANEPIPVSLAAFPASQGPPPPVVAVEDVVTAVWDEASQDIDGPDLDRAPKAAGDGYDDVTLVNVPTWFWVQNVQAALAQDGRIDLDVSIPGTPVQASLTASTDGVQVTSPVGAASCTVDQAKTEWSTGVAETSACTFPFSRANTAGWPVTAQTTWTGTWEGTDSDGATGGTLETLTPSATIDVPVAESQAIVDDVG